MNKPSLIVTIPPYAPFVREVVQHRAVSGLRLNTVMPVQEPLEKVVGRLHDEMARAGKELWIDLKCRQLRVASYGVPPFTEIELTHIIQVQTPVKAYFSDGRESATVLRVEGKKLLMQEGPKRVVGPGESINIRHPSLTIDGYLTETDKAYIAVAKSVGVHTYMASFVEQQSDIDTIRALDADASIVAKIESRKGVEFVLREHRDMGVMVARGDLFVELDWPHQVVEVMERVHEKYPRAIVASRFMSSLAHSSEPSCADIGDVDNALRMGYKTLMLGDDICQARDSVISAINLFDAMAKRYVS